MAKELWKGNEAIAEAAIRAGCRYFFGYPITPQNEIPEYFSRHLPEHGGCFVQAESEIAAINMVYGAAGAGARVMTSSSSPGISLKQEGITYIACAELPAVIVNMMRGGPGLGNIAPSQADYYQATRGGGNGDYRTVVLAPSTIQEAADLTQEAFDIADFYRTPVVVLADGMIGQMMEAIEWRKPKERVLPPKDWSTDGSKGKRSHNIVNSLFIDAKDCAAQNRRLQEKYDRITANEIRFEEFMAEDAEVLFVAYGTTARIARAAVLKLRKDGVKAGLFRPVTLWPFPERALRERAAMESV
ncbi:MAG TPA: 3-methyl-2-oxobutanoate dehydrogenase subunit VorB, partial [Clostridia bacterium]|nr:3-methyl-2-oxobutanoate dehydrogenase subunit VorB [Clostridia bacterium]